MIFEMYFFLNLRVQNYKTLRKLNDLYKIATSKLHGIGPVRTQQLLSKIGDVEELFSNTLKSIWMHTGFNQSILKALNREEALKQAEIQLNFNEKNNVSTHFFLDSDYPRRLKQCNDAPIVVYSKGNADLNNTKIVSIVGTRDITNYGVRILNELIFSLKEEGVLVISGLAYGVDITAHRLCLEHNIPTIGVLGHGFDRIYPFKHRGTAKEMLENGGLVTEFMINTKPDRENFPMRNRIVAGMADATIVIESKIKGGSIITAELANDYSRDVFAFPGDIDRPYSEGCNDLIRKQKAHLITNGMDFLTFMNWNDEKVTHSNQIQLFQELDFNEMEIVKELQQENDLHADILCVRLNKTPSQINVLLFNLEMIGVIQQLPGKRFKLLNQVRA
jgi:DNA processing protein